MSLLKRLSVTLFSRIDDVVADIENHDALIRVAIEEQSKKVVQAKGQLIKLKRKRKIIENSLLGLKSDDSAWHRRALDESSTNEQRALQCLQRKKIIQEEIIKLEQGNHEYQLIIEKLVNDIQTSEQELTQIKRKRELLSARQSSSEITHQVNQTKESSFKQLQDTFDRWEANLDTKVIHIDEQLAINHSLNQLDDFSSSADLFEKTYLDKEKQSALKQELSELIKQHKKGESDE